MGTESHWQERRECGLEVKRALFRRKKPEYVFHTKTEPGRGQKFKVGAMGESHEDTDGRTALSPGYGGG